MAQNWATVTVNVKQKLASSFHEINDWEKESVLRKFLPPSSILAKTDVSNIIIVIEKKNDNSIDINLLDRVAMAIYKGKEFFYRVMNKKMKITKEDADKLAKILTEQSKKLDAMSSTYRIMASALMANRDNFIEVSSLDKHIKDYLDNPF